MDSSSTVQYGEFSDANLDLELDKKERNVDTIDIMLQCVHILFELEPNLENILMQKNWLDAGALVGELAESARGIVSNFFAALKATFFCRIVSKFFCRRHHKQLFAVLKAPFSFFFACSIKSPFAKSL